MVMRLARHLAGNGTFYFKEDFYLYFLEFFGAFSLPVGQTITPVFHHVAQPVSRTECYYLGKWRFVPGVGSSISTIPVFHLGSQYRCLISLRVNVSIVLQIGWLCFPEFPSFISQNRRAFQEKLILSREKRCHKGRNG